MTNRLNQQLGNYRLIRSLGSGGFADVYLGEHMYLHTQAAIKILQTRLTQNALQIFLAEARTIANLTHRNIVQVLEFGVEQDTPFLVMTYAPNGTLRQRHPHGSRLSLLKLSPTLGRWPTLSSMHMREKSFIVM
jgi:serine/threonine protein kinase